MKKLMFLLILFSLPYVFSESLEYKYISTIPIELIKLSDIKSIDELNKILDNNNTLTILCLDKLDKNTRYLLTYLGVKEYTPSKIPDLYNYTLVTDKILLYKKYTVYRDEDGIYIFNPPVNVNHSKFEFIKPYIIKVPNPKYIPNFDGYVLINNGTFILYPKKYVIRRADGSYIFIPPKNKSDEYRVIYTFNKPPTMIPETYNYTFVDNKGIFIIYPKKYYIRNKDGIYIFYPPVNVSKKTVYKISYPKISDGVYEIRKNKLLFLYDTNLNNIKTLNIIGKYIAKNGGVFAYINKVPPYYKNILVAGVGIQKIIPDENGDYAIEVAGRKIKVDLLDEDVIKNKLKSIKALKSLGINVSYIVTGDEGIKLVQKTDVDIDEAKELLNDYWFKKYYTNYTHLYFNSYYSYYINNDDIVGLSYYPLIYLEKAPETFDEPYGDLYPNVIHYKGTEDYGYWEYGPESKNEYYHEDNEPFWNDNEKSAEGWYYEGRYVTDDSDLWERYKYFEDWYVRNYAYLLAKGVDGLFLLSSDSYLLNVILGKEDLNSDNYSYSLDINKKIKYLIVPGSKGFNIVDNIPIIYIPTLLCDYYGVKILNMTYIPPKDEDFGVYVSNIIMFKPKLLIELKENGTCIMDFKNLAEWLTKYKKNFIIFKKRNVIYIKDNKNVKITIFKKNFPYNLYNIEEYKKDSYMYVIDNPPKYIYLGD